MASSNTSQEIRERAFRFACQVARISFAAGANPGARVIGDQLLRAGTSVGANLEEAKAASSTREFVRYVDIALREAREAVYWLRICVALKLADEGATEQLRDEGEQITRILGSIAIKTRTRLGTRAQV